MSIESLPKIVLLHAPDKEDPTKFLAIANESLRDGRSLPDHFSLNAFTDNQVGDGSSNPHNGSLVDCVKQADILIIDSELALRGTKDAMAAVSAYGEEKDGCKMKVVLYRRNT